MLFNHKEIQAAWVNKWAATEAKQNESDLTKGSPILPDSEMTTDISALLPILYGFAFIPDVRRVLEIGVGPGFSTRTFYDGLHHSGGGQLISVDKDEHSPRIIKHQDTKWTFVKAHSTADASMVKKVIGDDPLDLLFIDGCHSLKQVVQDYDTYEKFVRPGGYIIFHDSQTMRGVAIATTALKQQLGGINIFSSNGLSIFQKQY